MGVPHDLHLLRCRLVENHAEGHRELAERHLLEPMPADLFPLLLGQVLVDEGEHLAFLEVQVLGDPQEQVGRRARQDASLLDGGGLAPGGRLRLQVVQCLGKSGVLGFHRVKSAGRCPADRHTAVYIVDLQ